MKARWVCALAVMALFLLLTIGIPVWPELLALPLAGPLNLGMAVYAALLVGTPVLAFVYLYLRQRHPRQRQER